MRYGLVGSIAALAAGASLAFAQPPTRSTAPVVVPPIPTGSATTAYEPLATVPPPQPVDGSPALDMFGPGGPGDLGQSRPYNRGWVKGELLVWGVKNGPSSFPLIVTGTIANGAIPGSVGSITNFGGSDFYFGNFAGARFSVGSLLPGSSRIGVEGEGLILPKHSVVAAARGSALCLPVIGLPVLHELPVVLD